MQYVTGIHAKSVYTRLSWQNLLASIPCNLRGIFHSIDQSVHHPVLDLGMQCSPLQLIPLSWIVCFVIVALIGHWCASQDNSLNHHSIVIRDEMVGILHRNRDPLWKRTPHKQNPELVAGGAESLQLFYCVLHRATWEPPIYNWGLDSDPVTHIIILPLIKIWQAIPLLLLPLFTV